MKRFKFDYSLLFLLIIIFFSPRRELILYFLFCLVFHECGHLLFIFIFKYSILELKFSVLGFFLKLEEKKSVFWEDLFIYIGGIIFNTFLLLIPNKNIQWISIVLITVNLIPIYPLDGYNVIKTLLLSFFPIYYVEKYSNYLSVLIASILIYIAILYKIDLFIIINMIYLLILNLIKIFQFRITFNNILLKKFLSNYSYKIKYINLYEDYFKFIYKYNDIAIKLGEKVINEHELLNLKFTKS